MTSAHHRLLLAVVLAAGCLTARAAPEMVDNPPRPAQGLVTVGMAELWRAGGQGLRRTRARRLPDRRLRPRRRGDPLSELPGEPAAGLGPALAPAGHGGLPRARQHLRLGAGRGHGPRAGHRLGRLGHPLQKQLVDGLHLVAHRRPLIGLVQMELVAK